MQDSSLLMQNSSLFLMKNSSFLLTVAAPVNNLVAVDLTRRELHQQSQSVRYQKESKKESQKRGPKREPICQRSCKKRANMSKILPWKSCCGWGVGEGGAVAEALPTSTCVPARDCFETDGELVRTGEDW